MDRRNYLSPVFLFPAFWLFGVVLAQVHVISVQRAWSWRMWVVAFFVPAVFACAGLVVQELIRGRGGAGWTAWLARFRGRLRLRPILAACVVIGYLELVHQFVAAGTVPLFSSDIDRARFALPGGITIVLTDLLTVAAIIAIVYPPKLFARERLFELAIVGASLFGFALQAGRGSVVLPIVVGVIGRTLYWGPPRFEWLVASGALVVAIVAIAFFARTSQHSELPFETEFYSTDLPAVPWLLRPLVPVDLAIATNFEALARIVDYFPTVSDYGYWRYNVGFADRYLPALNVNAVAATQSSPYVTTTMVGSFWADGGFVGVLIGVVGVAVLSTASFVVARLTGQLRYVVVASYVLYMTLFGLYDNLFTGFPDWLIVVPLLFAVGTVAVPSSERSPGTAAAAAERRG